jgi:hypothetical protein
MSLPIEIRGHNGTGGVSAEVTRRGQLITAPIQYSKPYIATVNADDTAFNLVLPKPEKFFVITDVVLTGTKAIDNVLDATVVIYEADSETSVTPLNVLFQTALARSATIPLTGMNMISEHNAKYINIKSTDSVVEATLMGYYLGRHHEI